MKKMRFFLALALGLCLILALPMPSQAATVSSGASVLEVDTSEGPFKADQELPITLWLRDASGTFLDTADARVYVWAEQGSNSVRSDALKGSDSNGVLSFNVVDGKLDGKIAFLRSGEYKLFASLDNPASVSKPMRFITDIKGADSLTIGEKNIMPYSIQLSYQGHTIGHLFDGQIAGTALKVSPGLGGVEVKATVFDRDGKRVGSGISLTASANNTALRISPTNLVTDYNGEVTFKVYGDIAGDFKLYLEAGGHANTVPVQVQPERVVMHIASYTMEVDNKKLSLDAAPMIRSDRTYVPYRALGEAFGAKVEWFPASQSVYVSQSDKLVTMTNQSTRYTVNGMAKTMDAAPFIQNSRMMVPVRFVAENLGYKVNVTYNPDGTTKDVIFTK